jgi:hypothetical protein
MTPNDDEVDKAFRLITDAFHVNDIKGGAGFSACFNVVVNIMIKKNVPYEKINVLLDAFEDCVRCLDAETKIDRLPV